MADGVVQVAPDSTGKKIDTSELTVSAQTVERQRIVLGDDSTAAGLAKVSNSATGSTDYGLVVRPQNTDFTATGTISVTDSVVSAPTGNGALLTGTPTASSYVSAVLPGGDGVATVLITGLTSGTLYFEGSVDGTSGTTGSWVPILAKQIGLSSTSSLPSYSATSNSAWRMNIAGFSVMRVRSVGTLSGTPAITIRVSDQQQIVTLENPMPAVSTTSNASAIKGGVITSTSANFAAAATGTVGPVNVADAGVVTVIVKNQTAASAFTGSPVLVFEQSDDSTSWAPLLMANNATGAIASTATLTAPGANGELMFDAPMEGVNYFRVRVTTGPTTNPMTVVIQQGTLPFMPIVSVAGNLPAGTNYIGNVRLTDGTNSASVKPSSTAALATDLAQVVALHPSSPLPTGTNLVGYVRISDGASTLASVKGSGGVAQSTDSSLVVGLSPNSPITMPTPSTSFYTSTAATLLQNVKSSAGTVYQINWEVSNTSASAVTYYLKIYNKASAPVPASDTPVWTVAITSAASAGITQGSISFGQLGMRLSAGISVGVTGAAGNTDTTALVAWNAAPATAAGGCQLIVSYV